MLSEGIEGSARAPHTYLQRARGRRDRTLLCEDPSALAAGTGDGVSSAGPGSSSAKFVSAPAPALVDVWVRGLWARWLLALVPLTVSITQKRLSGRD